MTGTDHTLNKYLLDVWTSLHCFYDQRKGKQSTTCWEEKESLLWVTEEIFLHLNFWLFFLFRNDCEQPLSVLPQQTHLAPMVRVWTLPMRLLALDYGADIVYCEVRLLILPDRELFHKCSLLTCGWVALEARGGRMASFTGAHWKHQHSKHREFCGALPRIRSLGCREALWDTWARWIDEHRVRSLLWLL